MKTRNEIFATKLKRCFDETGATKPQVAEYIGCTPDAIHRWLRRDNYPAERFILKLAEFFDKDIEYFLTETEQAKEDESMEDDLIRHKRMVDTLMRENEELRQTIRELQDGKPKKA